jgi:hypothetical protein
LCYGGYVKIGSWTDLSGSCDMHSLHGIPEGTQAHHAETLNFGVEGEWAHR